MQIRVRHGVLMEIGIGRMRCCAHFCHDTQPGQRRGKGREREMGVGRRRGEGEGERERGWKERGEKRGRERL